MGGDVDERGRAAIPRRQARIAQRFEDAQWWLWPAVGLIERDVPIVVLVALSVAQPVVHHELQPGRGQQIEALGRNKLVAGQQLAADGARVGAEQGTFVLNHSVVKGTVAPE